MRSLSLLLLLALTACPPSLRKPESSQLVLTGTAYAGGYARRGEPLPDVSLSLRRADTGEELAMNTTSSAGGYRIAVTVTSGTRVVLIARLANFAPFAKALTVGPYTEITQSFSLQPITAFDCVDTSCSAPALDLEWDAPPPSATGGATGFELDFESPVQVDVRPDRPQVLALAWAQVTGNAGTLRLRVPLSAWSSLADATPGNGFIDVEAAQFDPNTGQWTSLGTKFLSSEFGLPVPESALPSLQRGEYAGGAVVHFSPTTERFLAVLSPRAAEEGCVTGKLVANDKPAPGATIALPGTEPVAADQDGAFCAIASTGDALLRAEGQYAGLPYALGAIPRPTIAAKCGGDCKSVGQVPVIPEALQLSALCKFSGRVIDAQGAPVANAEVVGFDDSLAGNAVKAFCGNLGTRCSLAAPSAADGTFTLNVPLLSSVYFGARASSSSAAGDTNRHGGQRFVTCPNEPLTLKLQRGEDRVEVSATFAGSSLTWLPPRAAARIQVLDNAGAPKWEINAPGTLTPPITFGVVPSGANELTAPVGMPASGDSFLVELNGIGRDGVVYVGVGTAIRP